MKSLHAIVICLGLLFCPPVLCASTALQTLFDSLGASANVTSPGAFRDQQAGYYTAGGLMVRAPVMGFAPIQVSLPHIGVSCGGIDAHLGSFSFISADNMGRALTRMGTGVGTYALQLSLKTIAPQVESIFSQLRKILFDVNQLQLGDCRMVQQLVASALPRESEMYRHACTDVMSQGRGAGDWFGAKTSCAQNTRAFETAREIGQRQQNRDSFDLQEANYTWHALSKMTGLSREMKEFVMTLVGTVIKRNAGGSFQYEYIPGMADSEDFIRAHLKGGRTKILSCRDSGKCLEVGRLEVAFSQEAQGNPCMMQRFRTTIELIKQKYEQKVALTPADIAFLNDTANLPVWKYIQISTAVGSHFLLDDAIEFIAGSVLLAQFDRAAAEVIGAFDALQGVQLNDERIQELKSNIQEARTRLQTMKGICQNGAIFRLNQMLRAYEHAVILEKGV